MIMRLRSSCQFQLFPNKKLIIKVQAINKSVTPTDDHLMAAVTIVWVWIKSPYELIYM